MRLWKIGNTLAWGYWASICYQECGNPWGTDASVIVPSTNSGLTLFCWCLRPGLTSDDCSWFWITLTLSFLLFDGVPTPYNMSIEVVLSILHLSRRMASRVDTLEELWRVWLDEVSMYSTLVSFKVCSHLVAMQINHISSFRSWRFVLWPWLWKTDLQPREWHGYSSVVAVYATLIGGIERNKIP